MTVTSPDGPPSLADAAKQLGVRIEDLDKSFGVVPIDPREAFMAFKWRPTAYPRGAHLARIEAHFPTPKSHPLARREVRAPMSPDCLAVSSTSRNPRITTIKTGKDLKKQHLVNSTYETKPELLCPQHPFQS